MKYKRIICASAIIVICASVLVINNFPVYSQGLEGKATLKEVAPNKEKWNLNLPPLEIGIHNSPKADEYSSLQGYTDETFPKYNPNSSQGRTIDLRSRDLSKLNLLDCYDTLVHSDLDDNTVWPPNLPSKFNPKKIMEIGKNPGLGVRELHKMGITGKGVSIGIIDQPLIVDHEEYKGRIKHYENFPNAKCGISEMHGPAVTSIAVGKSCGVAPGANVYYIATYGGDSMNGKFQYDYRYCASGIDRLIEINEKLKDNEKIRVISISLGFTPEEKGYSEFLEAMNKAKKAGILVLTATMEDSNEYGVAFNGAGRDVEMDPEQLQSYVTGIFWAQYTLQGGYHSNRILIPMDSRTTASPTGKDDYVFYREGGWSWCMPYMAGLYALACEVNPNITPETFLVEMQDTAQPHSITINEGAHKGEKIQIGKMVNPKKLIMEIKNNK